MNNMYDVIEALCKEKGETITQLCKNTNIPRSTFSELKAGRTKYLSNKYLPTVAEYLGVSTDYLLGNEKEPSAVDGAGLDDIIKFALFGGEASDAQFEEVKRFAQFIRERDKGDNQ